MKQYSFTSCQGDTTHKHTHIYTNTTHMKDYVKCIYSDV